MITELRFPHKMCARIIAFAESQSNNHAALRFLGQTVTRNDASHHRTVKNKLVYLKTTLIFLHQFFSTHYVHDLNLLSVETSHILASLTVGFSCLVKTFYLLTSLQCCLCAEVLIFWIFRILKLSCINLSISRFPFLSESGKSFND